MFALCGMAKTDASLIKVFQAGPNTAMQGQSLLVMNFLCGIGENQSLGAKQVEIRQCCTLGLKVLTAKAKGDK